MFPGHTDSLFFVMDDLGYLLCAIADAMCKWLYRKKKVLRKRQL
jgi:hypothetical protein